MNLAIFNFFWKFANRSPFLDAIFIFFARYLIYFLVLAIIIWLIKKPRREALFLFAELALSAIVARGLITEWIRFFYDHPRPFALLGFNPLVPESGASFPSGHMTFLFSLALIVWYYNRKFGWWLLGLSFIVGVARIFAGVHWPLDILGGIAIGALSAYAVHRILLPYWRKLVPEPSVVEVVEVEEIDIVEIPA
jgi:undecaprenyl-diphosphatase